MKQLTTESETIMPVSEKILIVYGITSIDGHVYRLQEISIVCKRLLDERDERVFLFKQYKRVLNIMDGANIALISVYTGRVKWLLDYFQHFCSFNDIST